MRAGTLRHPVTIQEPIDGPSSTLTWATFATSRASLDPISGREFFSMQGIDTATTHRIRMRYLAGITAKMRLVIGTRRFRIAAPPRNLKERNRELEIFAEEIL